ncbi:hypothetical protein RJ639_031519 [Escallonia herrerae]|uniref:Retroviral polymerase SH3-like domain-containing protein n=1 Tax=Escallonia herrerae TaxID=1293975 RepID=A0AA89BMG8_9ASTE|nr:hypothetical protein RJ639_031519 [Escallonia herrerae]
MIGAYVTNGEPFRALELFSHGMHDSGVPLDAHTFASVLKACGENTYLSLGTQIHGLVIKLGFGSNVFVTNSLMGMYTKCSDLDAIVLLFGRLKEKDDAVSWNLVISAYSANGQSLEALRLFREMRKGGVTPSTYTFVAVLQACDEPSYSSSILELHAAILKFTYSSDIYVANALVVAYTRCGRIGEGAKVFSKMDEKDNISCNSILSGLVQNGLYYEALQSFHEMQRAGLKPDQCTLLILLTASGRLGNLSHGTELHAYAIKNIMETDLQVENTLIDMYAKCRRLNYMDTVFSRMSFKDFVSWTTIITGCAQNNCDLRAIHLFREVQMEGMYVDPMIIGSVLLACSGLKCIPLVQEIHGYIVKRGLSDHVLENTLVDVYGPVSFSAGVQAIRQHLFSLRNHYQRIQSDLQSRSGVFPSSLTWPRRQKPPSLSASIELQNITCPVKQIQTYQFLMGLDDKYVTLRTQIINMDLFPNIDRVYAMVMQEESHRGITSSRDTTPTVAFHAQNGPPTTRSSGLVSATAGDPDRTPTERPCALASAATTQNNNPSLDQAQAVATSVLPGLTPEQMQCLITFLESSPSATDANYFVAFSHDICVLKDRTSKSPIGLGKMHLGVFLFQPLSTATVAAASEFESYELGHRRMGHPSSKKGWRVYDLETYQVFFSRDVKFEETVFPFTTPLGPSPIPATTTFCPAWDCAEHPMASPPVKEETHHQRQGEIPHPHRLPLLPLVRRVSLRVLTPRSPLRLIH